MKLLSKFSFLLLVFIVFFSLDILIANWDPVNRYGFFYQNDFSKTVQVHNKRPWPKVFFGSSIVTGAYREDLSSSKLVNLGIDYGKVTDLEKLLEGGYLNNTKNLVLGLNYMTLMDNLPTNPYYQWHRRFYQPYVYFYRTPIRWYLERDLKALVKSQPLFTIDPAAFKKEIYEGRMTKEQLQQKVESYSKRFGHNTVNDFQVNLQALEKVIKHCEENKIELKCVWMPVNPVYDLPQYAKDVKSQADAILAKYNITTVDWTSRFGSEYFHDLVHMSWEKGAPEFTREFDKWLGM
mgnify:CR=1 FL=1